MKDCEKNLVFRKIREFLGYGPGWTMRGAILEFLLDYGMKLILILLWSPVIIPLFICIYIMYLLEKLGDKIMLTLRKHKQIKQV